MARNKCDTVGPCGLCYSGARGRAAFPGHYGYVNRRRPRYRGMDVGLRRPQEAMADVPAGVSAADDWMQGRYPSIWSYLADTRYEDGSGRETATMMILAEAGVVKCCLNDRDNCRSTWVSGRSVQEALEALETGLANGRTEWRVRSPNQRQARPKK